MTETTQPDPQVVRVYPGGWTLGYLAIGDEADGTARVPWAMDREEAAEVAADAERVTGAPMEVFRDEERGTSCWSYRPTLPAAARKPLTVADIPAGRGPASLHLYQRNGVTALRYRNEHGHSVLVDSTARPRSAGPAEAVAALWEHLAATLPTVTDEEEA